MRWRILWSQMLALATIVLFLVGMVILEGWLDGLFRPMMLFTIYTGVLMLPAVIGMLRREVDAWSAR